MTVADNGAGALTLPADDYVLPFQIETAGARGRLIRADKTIEAILEQHNYPEPVSALLGEALTLAALLGTALKIEDGGMILQTSSDGPVSTLVAQYKSSGDMRGYASFDQEAIDALQNGAARDSAGLLGDGHLAMTIDPGAGLERYQGVVALEGETLAEAADLYFRQSEQIPTFLRVAVARAYTAGENGNAPVWGWRAGGLLVQKLTGEGGVSDRADSEQLDWSAPDDGDEDWVRARTLASTVEDHELLDPDLPPERLLYRLFHEEQVRAFPPSQVQAVCSCSRARIEDILNSFEKTELDGMVEQGRILVKCEFCNRHYDFDPAEVGGEKPTEL
ncbi:MAG: Hsp33 family molecular chaperone [Hyphomicrobiales bacterium]|nr:Hsp33 family molecular chaperone [Hyphomicrobiales bacterium]